MSVGSVLADYLALAAEREGISPAEALLAAVRVLAERGALGHCSPVVDALATAGLAPVAGPWDWLADDGIEPDACVTRYGVVEGQVRPVLAVEREYDDDGRPIGWFAGGMESSRAAWHQIGQYDTLDEAVDAALVYARAAGWALAGPERPQAPFER